MHFLAFLMKIAEINSFKNLTCIFSTNLNNKVQRSHTLACMNPMLHFNTQSKLNRGYKINALLTLASTEGEKIYIPQQTNKKKLTLEGNFSHFQVD